MRGRDGDLILSGGGCEVIVWEVDEKSIIAVGADGHEETFAIADALRGGPGWPGPHPLRFINLQNVALLREGGFLATLKEIAARHEQVVFE